MANILLMPKATAVWLVDNTSLTFRQIANFCGLHELEVKGIADGDVAQGIKGMDPIVSGQIARDELERAQEDSSYQIKLAEAKVEIPEIKTKRGPRYTPVSRRQDRPDAISWLLRNHPEMTDGQVTKLVGTTKPTIQTIRDRTHWNSPNIKPVDPVTLALCSQIELDEAVQKAARRVARERQREEKEADKSGTLRPVEETLGEAESEPSPAAPQAAAPAEKPAAPTPPEPEEDDNLDLDSVFASLKDLKTDQDETDQEKTEGSK